MGEFVPRPKTLGGDIPCLDSPKLARKRQKTLSARAELRAERLLRAESNLETPVETQADGAPLFRISDLSAGYDKKVVVEGVDLEVRAGDVVALIGPNGSGKSTILKTITRHLAPLAGAVELDGREISRWKTAEFARNLAVMLTDRPRTSESVSINISPRKERLVSYINSLDSNHLMYVLDSPNKAIENSKPTGI